MLKSSEMLLRSQEGKQISILSSELNLANFAISSGVLGRSWDAISETKVHFEDQLSGSDLTIQFNKEPTKSNVLAFVASPISMTRLSEKRELVSSSLISDFSFLRPPRRNSSFSINETALSLFDSRKDDLLHLVAQTAEAAKSKPFIITGDGIGGSVASLFALQLLKSLDTTKAKPPLCITFGSPLLGDRVLQEAIKNSTWDSCFLHVVSMDDSFPSLFVQPDHPRAYHPFGKFMFCSSSGSACFENPESALILLRKTSAESGRNEQSFDYGSVIASLRKWLICKDKNNLNANVTGSSRGRPSIAAQYLSALFQLQDVGRNPQLEELLRNEMFDLEEKIRALQKKAEDLNKSKVYMAQMEWYKKSSEEKEIAYYDRYKNQSLTADFKLNIYIGYLQNYWEREVKEAEQKPQKAEAPLRVRWLLGGTNYRRIVEPLAIADYYKRKGDRDYINQGRSQDRLRHYKLLEEWFKKYQAGREKEKQNLPPSLTEDSCFWAHVEVAIIISREILNKGESAGSEVEKLKEFEEYVFERIKKYEVSSDIFWEKSSFMKWWKDYEKILHRGLMGTSYSSPLFEIMHNHEYKKYKEGKLYC